MLKDDPDDARAKAGLDEAVANIQCNKAASIAALTPNEVASKQGQLIKNLEKEIVNKHKALAAQHVVCSEAGEKHRGMAKGILEKQGKIDEAEATYSAALLQVAQAKDIAVLPAGLDFDIAAKTEMARQAAQVGAVPLEQQKVYEALISWSSSSMTPKMTAPKKSLLLSNLFPRISILHFLLRV